MQLHKQLTSVLEDGAEEFTQNSAQQIKIKMENYERVITRHGKGFERLRPRGESKERISADGGKPQDSRAAEASGILGQKVLADC